MNEFFVSFFGGVLVFLVLFLLFSCGPISISISNSTVDRAKDKTPTVISTECVGNETKKISAVIVNAEGEDLVIHCYNHQDTIKFDFGEKSFKCYLEITDIQRKNEFDSSGFHISLFAEGSTDQNSIDLSFLLSRFNQETRDDRSVLQNIVIGNTKEVGEEKIRDIVIQVMKKIHPEKTIQSE